MLVSMLNNETVAFLPSERQQVEHMRRIANDIDELRGKTLACWCPVDHKCHADVLLALANRAPTEQEVRNRIHQNRSDSQMETTQEDS